MTRNQSRLLCHAGYHEALGGNACAELARRVGDLHRLSSCCRRVALWSCVREQVPFALSRRRGVAHLRPCPAPVPQLEGSRACRSDASPPDRLR
jgi:hypothetical protein